MDEQRRDASKHAGASPVHFCHSWLELACRKVKKYSMCELHTGMLRYVYFLHSIVLRPLAWWLPPFCTLSLDQKWGGSCIFTVGYAKLSMIVSIETKLISLLRHWLLNSRVFKTTINGGRRHMYKTNRTLDQTREFDQCKMNQSNTVEILCSRWSNHGLVQWDFVT